jgi:hypothetical protein
MVKELSYTLVITYLEMVLVILLKGKRKEKQFVAYFLLAHKLFVRKVSLLANNLFWRVILL